MPLAVAVDLSWEVLMGLFVFASAAAGIVGVWYVTQYRLNAEEERMKEERQKFVEAVAALQGQIVMLQNSDRVHEQQVAVFATKLDQVVETLKKIERILEGGRDTPHGNE